MWPEHKKLFLSKHKYQKNLPTIKEFSMELNGDEFDDGDDDDDDNNNNNNNNNVDDNDNITFSIGGLVSIHSKQNRMQ